MANNSKDNPEIFSFAGDLAHCLEELHLLPKFEFKSIVNICNNLWKVVSNSNSKSKYYMALTMKLYKLLFFTLEQTAASYKTLSIEDKDSFHRLFEVLVRIESALLSSKINLNSHQNSGALETEDENLNYFLDGVLGTQDKMGKNEYHKGNLLKKLQFKARLKLLVVLLGEENSKAEEILGLLQAIQQDIKSFINSSQEMYNSLRKLKYKMLWIEVLYCVISSKDSVALEAVESKQLEKIIWGCLKLFEHFTSSSNKALKHEGVMLRILKEEIVADLQNSVQCVSFNKQMKYYLTLADAFRKMAYLRLYIGLQEENDKKLEISAATTSCAKEDLKHSLQAFQQALRLENLPQRGFAEYMSGWLGKKSEFRAAFNLLLQEMKVSEILKVQK